MQKLILMLMVMAILMLKQMVNLVKIIMGTIMKLFVKIKRLMLTQV